MNITKIYNSKSHKCWFIIQNQLCFKFNRRNLQNKIAVMYFMEAIPLLFASLNVYYSIPLIISYRPLQILVFFTTTKKLTTITRNYPQITRDVHRKSLFLHRTAPVRCMWCELAKLTKEFWALWVVTNSIIH